MASFIFASFWSFRYIGHPEYVVTDQASITISKYSEERCKIAVVLLRHTGTDSHNSLSAPTKSFTFSSRKRTTKYWHLIPHGFSGAQIGCQRRGMTSTAGPDGLIPALLVFGVVPRLPGVYSKQPKQKQRFATIQATRWEFSALVVRNRVQKGLSKKLPERNRHGRLVVPGSSVYVYRKKLKQWTGPHVVADEVVRRKDEHLGERTGPRTFNAA